MSTVRTLRTLSAASAALLLAAAAHATNYTSAATGNWSTNTNWTPNGVPRASDTVTISSGHVITISDARQITSVTVSNGQLKLDGSSTTTAELEFPSSASSPSMSLAAADDLYLVDFARVKVSQSMTWSDGGAGSVKGDDGDSCEIKLDGSAAAVTLTLNVPVHGALQLIGTAGNTENVANNAGIFADIFGEVMLLGSTLNSVSDGTGSCASPLWKAVGQDPDADPIVYATLQFDVAASSLDYFLIDAGKLHVTQAVSAAGKRVINNGTITTAGSGSFTANDCTP